MMASVLNNAQIKQHLAVIILIDLRSAEEVHHNLNIEVLIHHYLPSSLQALQSSLHDNFQTFIITDNVTTASYPHCAKSTTKAQGSY